MNPAPTMLRLARAWLPVLAWMAILFMASTDVMSAGHTSRFLEPMLRRLIPGISPAHLDLAHLVIRKAAHVTEYAILAVLLCRALWLTNGALIGMKKVIFVAVSVSALYAAGDEFHQSFVQSRTASAHDVLYDVSGAILGAALSCTLQNLKIRRAARYKATRFQIP